MSSEPPESPDGSAAEDRPLNEEVRVLRSELEQIKAGMAKLQEIAPRDPAMALVRARKILECVVRDLFARHLPGEKPGTQPLQSLIDRLATKNVLGDHTIKAYATTVCVLGNAGAHYHTGPEPTLKDVVQAHEALVRVLEWYFEKERIGDIGQLRGEVDASDAVVQNYAVGVRSADRARGNLRGKRRAGGLAIVSLLALVLWAEHRWTGFGPPWPPAAVTAVSGWLVMTIAWFANDARVERYAMPRSAPGWLIAAAAAMLAVFVALFSLLTIPAPDWPNLESRGLWLNPGVAKVFQDNPWMTVKDALEGSAMPGEPRDPHRVWVPWTVDLVRFVLFATWLGVVGCAAVLADFFWWSLQESYHDGLSVA